MNHYSTPKEWDEWLKTAPRWAIDAAHDIPLEDGDWIKYAESAETILKHAKPILNDHRALRSICLKIHSARIAMNEKAVHEGLNELDAYFREANEN